MSRLPHACVFWVTLSGCWAIRSTALGPPARPRPADCPIAIERRAPDQLRPRYQQIGVMCINVEPTAPYSPGLIQDDVRAEGCRLGGELVTTVGLCTVNRLDGVELGVFRTRAVP
jgi:hypothetical protein